MNLQADIFLFLNVTKYEQKDEFAKSAISEKSQKNGKHWKKRLLQYFYLNNLNLFMLPAKVKTILIETTIILTLSLIFMLFLC